MKNGLFSMISYELVDEANLVHLCLVLTSKAELHLKKDRLLVVMEMLQVAKRT